MGRYSARLIDGTRASRMEAPGDVLGKSPLAQPVTAIRFMAERRNFVPRNAKKRRTNIFSSNITKVCLRETSSDKFIHFYILDELRAVVV